MGMESKCETCVQRLQDENQLLWAETLSLIGDHSNHDWCRVCSELFGKPEALELYEEVEIFSTPSVT